jgi:hypothetical protein
MPWEDYCIPFRMMFVFVCVCAYAQLKVGPTRFLIRERFLDSRFPPPHGCNVRWSDLIAISLTS